MMKRFLCYMWGHRATLAWCPEANHWAYVCRRCLKHSDDAAREVAARSVNDQAGLD